MGRARLDREIPAHAGLCFHPKGHIPANNSLDSQFSTAIVYVNAPETSYIVVLATTN